MASNVGDKLLWTAVVVTGIAAYWYVPYFLTYAKELAAVPPTPLDDTKPQLQTAAEDAIENSTLAKLAGGPSYNLTASAIRLTAARFVKSDAKRRLLDDLRSKSWERREQAINGLQLLIFSPDLKDSGIRQHFTDDTTFTALVNTLVNLRDENKHKYNPPTSNLPPSPVRPAYRPAHERLILKILLALIDTPRGGFTSYFGNPARPVLKAGIVQKWLADYPFPCALPGNAKYNYKKSDVCRLLDEEVWGYDDLLMSSLVHKLRQLPSGVSSLVEVGLSNSSFEKQVQSATQLRTTSHSRDPQFFQAAVTLTDEEPVVGELIDDDELMIRLGSTSAPRNSTEQTPEERSLRRRHRNAVVVAEPGSSLRPENILQRQNTETDEESLLHAAEEVEMLYGDISFARLLDSRSLDEIDGLPAESLRDGLILPPDIPFDEPEEP